MSLFDFFRLSPKPKKLFKEGQEITLRRPVRWTHLWTGHKLSVGPKFGEIVLVCKYISFQEGNWYISVNEYNEAFRESDFEPVLSNNQLEDALGELNRIVMIDVRY